MTPYEKFISKNTVIYFFLFFTINIRSIQLLRYNMAEVKIIISTIYHVTFIHVRMNVHKRSPINRRNEWANEWRCIKFFHENKGHPPFPASGIIFYGIKIKGAKSLRSFVKDIGEMTNDSKSDPRQIVALPFRLPTLVADLSFPSLSLLFVSWPTSVLRAIPYYAALHCHNPYITWRSDESEFMVQGAPSASRISENFWREKALQGRTLGHVTPCVD